MYTDFDFHSGTGVAAIRTVSPEHEMKIIVTNFHSDSPLAIIENRYLPQGPRISPDGRSLAFFGNGRIHVHSFETNTTKAVFDRPGIHAGFPCWSADGTELAFSAYDTPIDRSHPPKIFCIELATGKTTQISDGPGDDRFPHSSATGRYVAFHRGNSIVVADRRAGKLLSLPRIEGMSYSIGHQCWHPDDSHMLVTERSDSTARLLSVRLQDCSTEILLEGAAIQAGCFSQNGKTLLCVRSDRLGLYSFPGVKKIEELALDEFASVKATRMGPYLSFDAEDSAIYFLGTDFGIYQWRQGKGCALVRKAQSTEADTEPAYKKEEYWFAARDGYRVPVLRYVPAKTNGMTVMFIHGGPGGTIDPKRPIPLRLLREGYEVIRPSYRGSDGYGADHRNANRHECGRADVWDVVDCGIDWRKRFGTADSLLAVSGYSYGGFLTFLALTDPAAVWSCGITLWGGTMIPPSHANQGVPSDNEAREAALLERSPVAQAARIKHPLLILHGARDTTSSVSDVSRIQQSVKSAGIPCELVIFENDGHGLHLNRDAMFQHMFDFLEAYGGSSTNSRNE